MHKNVEGEITDPNPDQYYMANSDTNEEPCEVVSYQDHISFIELYDKTTDKIYDSEKDSSVPTLTPGHSYEVRYNFFNESQKVSIRNPRFKADGIFFWLEPDDFAESQPRGFQHNLAAGFIVNHYKIYDQLDLCIEEPIGIETDHCYYLRIEDGEPIIYGEAAVEGVHGVIFGAERENDNAEELIIPAGASGYFSYEFSVEKDLSNRHTEN